MHHRTDVIRFVRHDLTGGVFQKVVMTSRTDVVTQYSDVVITIRPRLLVVEPQHVTNFVRHTTKLKRKEKAK